MGLVKGTLSFSRYRVVDTLPGNTRDFIDKQIKLFAFRELTTAGEKAMGWTSLENVLDTNFEYANYVLADYFIFSLRIDRKVIPPSLHKLKVLEAEKKIMAQKGKKKIYRQEREEIKENVRLTLLDKTPPTPSFYEICWNSSQGWLLFGSHAKKIREDFEEFFKRTFNLTLVPHYPWDVSHMDREAAETVASLKTEIFSVPKR
jgi:DNA recombination-dependent growth factor C